MAAEAAHAGFDVVDGFTYAEFDGPDATKIIAARQFQPSIIAMTAAAMQR